MLTPYEGEAKIDLRVRLLDALDSAGLEITGRELSIPYPIGFEQLKGFIRIDVQCREDPNWLANYICRPGDTANAPVPQWLALRVRAITQLGGQLSYIVVEKSGVILEDSCRRLGAGVFVLDESGYLHQRVAAARVDVVDLSSTVLKEVNAVRSLLQAKHDMAKSNNLNNYNASGHIVEEMDSVTGDKYRSAYSDVALKLQEAYEAYSVELDKVLDANSVQGLEQIRDAIEESNLWKDL